MRLQSAFCSRPSPALSPEADAISLSARSGRREAQWGVRQTGPAPVLDGRAEEPSSGGVKPLSPLNLEARLEALYAAGSTPKSITVSMEDWLDIAKRAKDKARGNAIAGYTFAGVPVLIDKDQTAVVVQSDS